jgi:hypothetical protein
MLEKYLDVRERKEQENGENHNTRKRWEGRIAHMGQMRCTCRISLENL